MTKSKGQMYRDCSCTEYVNAIACKKPIPGGGSSVGLGGAMGMALNLMACNYTLGNPKYEEVQTQMEMISSRGQEIQERMLEIIDLDAAIYNKTAKVLKMPRTTDAEVAIRKKSLENCSKEGALLQLEAMEISYEAMKLTLDTAKLGNKNLITDAACAGNFLWASLKSARLNVLANLKTMKEEQVRQDIEERQEILFEKGKRLSAEIERIVMKNL